MKTIKKYKLTERCIVDSKGSTLFQIQALRSFGGIKKGQLGGYVRSEYNLSHKGNCWIYPNASASGASKVLDNAVLKDYATLKDNSIAYNDTVMMDHAKLEGFATISHNKIMRNKDYDYCLYLH